MSGAVMIREANLTIGEVAQSYNVSLRTLRFYEERGLLAPSRIGSSRCYGDRELTRLQLIQQAKRMGFTLSEIARIIKSAEASSAWPAETTTVLTRCQIEARIAALEQRRDNMDTAIQELRAALSNERAADSSARGF